MKIIPLPTLQILNDLLAYDLETGSFTWKKFRGCTAKAGSLTGNLSASGYIGLCINGKRYLAHRIAYKIVYGCDPNGILDHIDGDVTNNCISNLRVATFKQNQGNSKTPKHNISGIKGVSWKAKDNRWVAQIKHGRKKIWLGGYKTKEEAGAAYQKAANEYFGEFAKTGEGL
jgi:hypothetical protein